MKQGSSVVRRSVRRPIFLRGENPAVYGEEEVTAVPLLTVGFIPALKGASSLRDSNERWLYRMTEFGSSSHGYFGGSKTEFHRTNLRITKRVPRVY